MFSEGQGTSNRREQTPEYNPNEGDEETATLTPERESAGKITSYNSESYSNCFRFLNH
jgi:hypothetical protein